MDIQLEIEKAAVDLFGIYGLKPYQLLVISRILEQEGSPDCDQQLVILPTGTGKSLCFLIPAVLCRKKTLIVYPLLALMNDQIHVLEKSGIKYVCFRGGQTVDQRKQQFDKLRNGVKIIITNPETLMNPQLIENLKEFEYSLFVCDEVHVIKEWGEQFRPAYRRLKEIVEILNPEQILAFTATADSDVIENVEKYLFTSEPLIVRGDADRDNICYSAFPAPDYETGVISILRDCEKPALVFCGTRNQSKKLCCSAIARIRGVPMLYYHAGLSKPERQAVEQWFMDCNDGVLFSTCAFGMGVSKNNIRTVIHVYYPSDVLEYLQESGRAGRDMKAANAFVILSADISQKLKENPVVRIFTSYKCRRISLLEQLGQAKDECSGCDVCLNCVKSEYTGEKEIVKLIKRRPLRYTFADIPWLVGDERDFRNCREGFVFDPFYKCLGFMYREEIEKTVKALTCGEDNRLRPLVKFDFPWRNGLLAAKTEKAKAGKAKV